MGYGTYRHPRHPSEWRRRWMTSAPSSPFDGQVSVSEDDGRWVETGAFSSAAADTSMGRWPDAATIFNGFLRFQNVLIPGGATITAAFLDVNAIRTGLDGAGVRTNIYFEDSDDAVAPTSTAEGNALVRTTAFSAWDDVNFVVDVFTQSPSIVDVIQEIVDRGGWSSGQAMMAIVDDDASDDPKLYEHHSFDSDPAKASQLHVEFTA